MNRLAGAVSLRARTRADDRYAQDNKLCLPDIFLVSHFIFALRLRSRSFLLLHVIEQRHEPEVHVQLLVTVEESKTGMIGNEVNLQLLIAAQHDHVLHDARGFRSCEISELKAVAMKMNRMNVVTGVAHPKAIAFALLQME